MNTAVVGCLCPPDGSRHPAGDEVTFRETLGFRDVLGFQRAIGWFNDQNPDADVPETLTFLSEWYLLHCIESWTLADAKGKRLQVSKANVSEYVLTKFEPAIELANFADELYTKVLLLPLANKGETSSPRSRMNGSTSATPGSGKSPTRSKRSSTTSTQMAATATT